MFGHILDCGLGANRMIDWGITIPENNDSIMKNLVLGTSNRLRWSLFFSIMLAALLLFLSLRGADWEQMANILAQGRMERIFFAIVVLSGSCFVRGLRWRLLLSAEKLISPITVFWGIMVGYLGNSFLPARAGEVLRSVLIGHHTNISKSYVLATAVTERVIDALALIIFGLAAIQWLSVTPVWLANTARAMVFLVVLCVLAMLILSRLEQKFMSILSILPIPEIVRTRGAAIIERFLLGLRAFQHPYRAAGFAAFTMAIWLIDTLAAIQVGAAFGMAITAPQTIILLTALGLASAAPSAPGYIGVYQFVAVTVLPAFGYSQDQALVYITAYQAIGYLVAIFWGAIGFWRLNARNEHATVTNELS